MVLTDRQCSRAATAQHLWNSWKKKQGESRNDKAHALKMFVSATGA
jgi:hypothetical protein